MDNYIMNSEQRDHYNWLSKQKPENLCYCGWYLKGQCLECPPKLSAVDKLSGLVLKKQGE